MSEAVLADAQFSVAKVVRPFPNFESVYQGLPVSVPIAFPGTLDRFAGRPGYDPNLISGIPVPFGSKVMIWIPTIFSNVVGSLESKVVPPYRYRFIWRLRSIQDFRNSRAAFHFPKQSPGQDNQFVVPSAAKVAIYEGAGQNYATNTTEEPISQFTSYEEARQAAFLEAISFPSLVPSPPKTPDGSPGSFQQGMAASGGAGGNTTVTYNSIQLDAEGDELIILVDRNFTPTDDNRFWDFTAGTQDFGFSAFYGTANGARSTAVPDLGIYVFTGSNP